MGTRFANDVVGVYSPPFDDRSVEQRAEIIGEINRSKADVVWVGLSTPKQERFLSDVATHLNAKVGIGVGAA